MSRAETRESATQNGPWPAATSSSSLSTTMSRADFLSTRWSTETARTDASWTRYSPSASARQPSVILEAEDDILRRPRGIE